MTWLVTALCVIVVPGVLSLWLVRRRGPASGVVILIGMLMWRVGTFLAARHSQNIPVQPEIFGGQAVGNSQRGGLRDMFWAVFVLGLATLWAALALLIGRASYQCAQHPQAQP